ncbi:hypothetical protein WR25_03285 [Diploscapter pachys]|uniref:Uncharacterized protein n=1 Tax=Diploscapter pachys TaxID=2018661 RepID=A0A2A2JQA1_9BILA|nr:hypothetical protein WR25_03285 [Diploscapter pachys]
MMDVKTTVRRKSMADLRLGTSVASLVQIRPQACSGPYRMSEVMFSEAMPMKNVYDLCQTLPSSIDRIGERLSSDECVVGPFFGEQLCSDLHKCFRFRIECRGGFIQQKNPWVPNECSGNRNSLLLPSTQLRAPVSNNRVVFLRQGFDEFLCIRHSTGSLDLLECNVQIAVL